ncbi:MAG: carboxypeptidase-like regulatory domain-containing protein, partial [Planctomycetota bacterium]
AGIVMTKGTWIAIAVAGAFIAAMIGRHDTEPLKKDVGRTTGGIREDVPLAAPARVEGRRRAEPVPSEARRSSESPTTPAIALDLDGRPMAAVKLLLKRDGEAVVEVTTDVEGRFEMRTDRTIEAADETLAALAYRDLDGLREVRLAQTVRVAGEVVDVDGRPVDRGYVADRSSAARAGLALDPRSPYVGLYRSLAGEFWPDNRFDLGHVATWPGKTLRVHSVLGTLDVPVPPADTTELRVVFPSSLESDSITVRVIDERGRPATDGAVSIGHVARPTDDSGTATFELGRDNDARTIVATRHGFVPISVPRPSGGDVDVEIAVTERGGSVTGLVVDAEGAPVTGAEVVVWDGGVPFGRYAVAELVDDLDVGMSLPFETDAEGRFEISGLADGPYTLRALALDPLRIGTARDVVPGDDVVIRLPDASGAIPIEGRVVDVSGRPVQGARVQAGATKRRWREGEWLNSLADPYNGYFLAHSNSFISITDADGRFRLPDLAQEGLLLFAEKDSARASVEATARDLTIVLDRECSITVNLEPSSRQHRLAAVDASGRFLRYRRKDRSLVLSPGVVPFGSGSLDLTVPQSTVALVLLERGREVARVAIEPDPAVRIQVRL